MREKQRKLLIDLRSQLIGEKGTLPYCVYQDSVIEELLKAQPKTIEELTRVKGFPKGGKRVKGFGECVVAIFRDTEKVEGFQLQGDTEHGFSVNTRTKKATAFN